ncbi:MAG TPA: NADH-quinone oxidoreductase subunit N [Chthoniobacterales bacterium]|nr:NADH-quinone oxidoreductase subunit N [Chthoniobacterales bacterium]
MISAPYLEVAVLVLGTVILLIESFSSKLDRRYLGYAALVGLTLIFLATFRVAPQTASSSAPFWDFYSADTTSLFFKRIALATTAGVIVMIFDFAPLVATGIQGATPQSGLGEFFALPLFTCAGLMWMSSAIDFVLIFVSLELVTISFYVLVGFTRRNPASLEAAVKYLVLSAVATGFLVYGITWIFGATGETNLQKITTALSRPGLEQNAALFGAVLVIIALGFKIAAVPFHIWVADVYQGAPTPVTAYLSVGSKAAGFVVLLRVLDPFLLLPQMQTLLVAIAVLTLIYGNLAALPQTNVKRLLAYSSIAHAGYLLVAVVSFSGRAVAFYLVAYLLMTLLSFAVLILVSQPGGDQLESFAGLSQRSPFLAFAMLVAMASLAGVPFTAGFLGKFLVFDAAIATHHFGLVVVAIVTVGAGFYYYFKVVRAIYWDAPSSSTDKIIVSPLTRAALIALIAGTFVLGVYPQPIFDALAR